MIVGLGIDIVEIQRMRQVLERQGERFRKRVFTRVEQQYCLNHRDPAPSFAARFAAKEAAFKALGTGWGKGVGWLEAEVVREPGQAPALRLSGQASKHAEACGVQSILLSLTHSENAAVAVVVLEGKGPFPSPQQSCGAGW